jgi:hypothetical protein
VSTNQKAGWDLKLGREQFKQTTEGVPCRRCSLQKVFPAEGVPCRRCSLQKVFPVEGVPCRRCSLWKVFPAEGVPCRRCSLQKVFPAEGVPCRRCSLQKVFPAEGVPYRRCSLQKVFPAEGVLIFRLWLFRVPRVRPGPSGFRPRRVSTTSPPQDVRPPRVLSHREIVSTSTRSNLHPWNTYVKMLVCLMRGSAACLAIMIDNTHTYSGCAPKSTPCSISCYL